MFKGDNADPRKEGRYFPNFMRIQEGPQTPYMPNSGFRKSVQSHSTWDEPFAPWEHSLLPETAASHDLFKQNVQKSKDFFFYTEIDT